MEGTQSFQALSRRTILPAFPHVCQPESSLNTTIWGFMVASLHKGDCLNHCPLAIDSTSSPSPIISGRSGWVGLNKVPTLKSRG